MGARNFNGGENRLTSQIWWKMSNLTLLQHFEFLETMKLMNLHWSPASTFSLELYEGSLDIQLFQLVCSDNFMIWIKNYLWMKEKWNLEIYSNWVERYKILLNKVPELRKTNVICFFLICGALASSLWCEYKIWSNHRKEMNVPGGWRPRRE